MLDNLRRIDRQQQTDAEKAICDAMYAVESAGAHPKLTAVINLLSEAKNKLGDYVDSTIKES